MERLQSVAISIPTPAWIEKALQDPEVTDLCLNGPDQAFLDRGRGFELLSIPDTESWAGVQFQKWVLDLLSSLGKTWDAKHPFADATLPTGFRIHIVFPPLTRQGILVSFRRLPWAGQGSCLDSKRIPAPGHSRWQDSLFFQKILEAVQRGDSILISGATGSGKTTLAMDLLSKIPTSERIIALEDTSELLPAHPHFIGLTCRPPNADGYGGVSLRSLLRQCLRMRPDRIILGECRGEEVLELLQALNTGHRGAMATLHANSPRDALRRIELLCMLGVGSSGHHSGGLGNPFSRQTIRELLSTGVQWVIQVRREGQTRKITELCRIEGCEGDTILMRPVLR
jgi:pilus assembly protein CpaF